MAKIEQAGAIVVRSGKNEPRILLVTARRNPDNWIFPKGHVESRETLKAAALREAREEAGVAGKVLAKAGSMSFDFGANRYSVHYFVVHTSDPGQELEGRRLRWFRYRQALRRLTYDETRDLLRGAWPRIQRSIARPAGTSRRSKASGSNSKPAANSKSPRGSRKKSVGSRSKASTRKTSRAKARRNKSRAKLSGRKKK